jgi:hypothetical protein
MRVCSLFFPGGFRRRWMQTPIDDAEGEEYVWRLKKICGNVLGKTYLRPCFG